jgi:hypothetical protein
MQSGNAYRSTLLADAGLGCFEHRNHLQAELLV